mmetsp:Transcript_29283/g.97338  ORF Transcript_29283/g.97338 Transcript_29283/m.97338 type:complete len:324 (-) Transcript_29283:998-1969(-)
MLLQEDELGHPPLCFDEALRTRQQCRLEVFAAAAPQEGSLVWRRFLRRRFLRGHTPRRSRAVPLGRCRHSALPRLRLLERSLVGEALAHLHLNVGEATDVPEPCGIPQHEPRWEDAVALARQQPHRCVAVHARPPRGDERVPAPGRVRGRGHVADGADPAAEAQRRAQKPQHRLAAALRHPHQHDALTLAVQEGGLVVHQALQEHVGAVHGVHVQDVNPRRAATPQQRRVGVLVPRHSVGQDQDHPQSASEAWRREVLLPAIPRRVDVEAMQADQGCSMAGKPRCDEGHGLVEVLQGSEGNSHHLDPRGGFELHSRHRQQRMV